MSQSRRRAPVPLESATRDRDDDHQHAQRALGVPAERTTSAAGIVVQVESGPPGLRRIGTCSGTGDKSAYRAGGGVARTTAAHGRDAAHGGRACCIGETAALPCIGSARLHAARMGSARLHAVRMGSARLHAVRRARPSNARATGVGAGAVRTARAAAAGVDFASGIVAASPAYSALPTDAASPAILRVGYADA
jgi:hypothetical protein